MKNYRKILSYVLIVTFIFSFVMFDASFAENLDVNSKAEAYSALQSEYKSYEFKNYSYENWETIKSEYVSGKLKIYQAGNAEEINDELNAAVSAMQAVEEKTEYIPIEGWSEGDIFNAGNEVGRVNIKIRNNTCSEVYDENDNLVPIDPSLEGVILSEDNYPIGENDSMMTVILRLLYDNAYTWNSDSDDNNDFTINYLAWIKDPAGNVLGEFSGGSHSGWMGSLNDFFTNEGFAQFTVANDKLAHGDIIDVQYTLSLGDDLGGSWGNYDTRISSLNIEGLTPEFNHDVQEYNLNLDSDIVELEVNPTAENKNFLIKSFLNEKVTTDVEGDSFYERTEKIPVVAGDVIWVGCGEYDWPSMNNQGDEAGDYSGTWYKLNIVKENIPLVLDEFKIKILGNVEELEKVAEQTIEKYDFEYITYFKATSPDGNVHVKYSDDLGEEKDVELGSDFKKIKASKYKTQNFEFGMESTDKYNVIVEKKPTLSKLRIENDGSYVPLDTSFNPKKNVYAIEVLDTVDELNLSLSSFLNSEESNLAQQVIKVNGNTISDFEHSVDISSTDQIVIDVKNNVTSKENTYTVNINKLAPVEVDFSITPSNSSVVMKDEDGNIIENSDESTDDIYKYMLSSGKTYTYHVSSKGYLSQTQSFTAENTTINVNLVPAPSSNIENLPSYWPQFRKESDNNAVVDTYTPITESKLKWATKVGTDWTNAVSPPIIVDGYIFVAKGANLVKMNKDTGEIIKEVPAVASGGYTAHLTYGDGMIFFPAGNGRVQAFNAKTMDSLWVSETLNQEQTLTPLYYDDGFLYTGTWRKKNEHTKGHFFGIDVTDEDPTSTNEIKGHSWTDFQKGGFYWSGGISLGDYMIYGSDSGIIKAVDQFNGKESDSFEVDGKVRSTIAASGNSLYFTTKEEGYVYKVNFNPTSGKFDKNSIIKVKPDNMIDSTSTPAIYNGRVYIGVGKTGEFNKGAFVVLDADTLEVAYSHYQTKGYPQSSALLTNAYPEYTYAYFTYNYIPGGIIVMKDKPGQTAVNLKDLFIPNGSQSQYCIASAICDEDGVIYYKNDSGYIFAVDRPTITEVEEFEDIEVKMGTPQEEVILPETIKMSTDIGTEIEASVEWQGSFDTSQSGEYVLTADYSLPEGYKGNKPLIKITIKVLSHPVVRVSGPDRFSTAVEASKFSFDTSESVILVNGYNFPDALSSNGLAAEISSPVLLVRKNSIPQATYDEIKRLKANKVYIVGGKGVVSETIANILIDNGFEVERLSGKDRYATSVEVAKKIEKIRGKATKLMIATGRSYPDAVCSSPLAIENEAPLILVSKNTIPMSVKNYLESHSEFDNVFIAGGKGVVSKDVENKLKSYSKSITRYGGKNRYLTSKLLAEALTTTPKSIVLTTGNGYIDALVSGNIIINKDYFGPILFTRKNSIPSSIQEYIMSKKKIIDIGIITGGTGVVSEDVKNIFKSILE